METTLVPVFPNAITTIVDETEEHVIYSKQTIQIDRTKVAELLKRLANVAEKLNLIPKRHIAKK